MLATRMRASSGLLLPSATFGSVAVSGSDLTTYTHSGMTFPDAAAGRYILAYTWAVSGSGLNSAATATIGGVSATSLIQIQASTTQSRGAFFIAALPTGASGNVAVTWSAACIRSGAAVWALRNLTSATPTDTASNNGAGQPSPLPLSIDVAADGLLFAGFGENNGRTATLAGVTEDFDSRLEGAQATIAGGSAAYAAAQTALAVSATWSGAPDFSNGLAVAFR